MISPMVLLHPSSVAATTVLHCRSKGTGIGMVLQVPMWTHTLIVLLDEHKKRRLLVSSPTSGGMVEVVASLGISSWSSSGYSCGPPTHNCPLPNNNLITNMFTVISMGT
jgi:hypothetical protein